MTRIDALAHDLGTSGRTIRRGIESGLIKGARTGSRRYELAPHEADYLRRDWPDLRRLVAALRTEPSVEACFLFGSLARGHAREVSDVDIAVQLRDDDPWRLHDLRDRLGVAAGRRVELVRLEDARARPALLAEILRDGRVLVDRGGVWRQLHRNRAAVERVADRWAADQAREGVRRLSALYD